MKKIDAGTFGKTKVLIGLTEELNRVGDANHAKAATLALITTKRALDSIDLRSSVVGQKFLAQLLRTYMLKSIEENTNLTDTKVISFLRNAVVAKINMFLKEIK